MNKIYSDKNVYEAAQERLNMIFDEFEKVIVSFSGGKDSGVVLNMAVDIARQRRRKLGVMFLDLEAFYQKTIDYVEKMFSENEDVLEAFWVCLPMESPNSLSYLEPTWTWWQPEKEPIWVRPMPQNKWVINLQNNPFGFYKQNMPFEKFILYMGDWYGQGKKTAQLVGIRTDESLNRWRAVAADNAQKNNYISESGKSITWSEKMSNTCYSFYPIYDWTVTDDWTYYGKYGKPYNHLYDLFYRAGVSLPKMRVDEPFGNEAKAGLNMFRVIEPETWARVVNRVSGANFGNIYAGKKIMNSKYTLPKGHTWKSFCKFLLTTLPEETANNYRRKFIKFIKYWARTGCPVRDDFIKEIESTAPGAYENTHKFSRRGNGDKEVIRARKVLDELPGIDNKQDLCTWKRMAMCIIKNDYICKGLCFSITKDLTLRQKAIIEKYKNI